MNQKEFESILETACVVIRAKLSSGTLYKSSSEFELEVRTVLAELLGGEMEIDFAPHPHLFPDICTPPFGVEVKFTLKDTWRSVANSIFEGTRDPDVSHVYLMLGKMGGEADVRWGRYGECIIHVRTSHVPRFEVELFPSDPLFDKLGIPYEQFRLLPTSERMKYIREYARGRLKKGERLWWLGDHQGEEHSLPVQARLFMGLEQAEKRQLRAEAAFLCPQIVKPPRGKHKYDDVALYLLTYHGVLCSQARDLFSAGSAAKSTKSARGGNYVQRALADIQDEMRLAATALDTTLLEEYWGHSVSEDKRILEWLKLADSYAVTWKPSDSLFCEEQKLQA